MALKKIIMMFLIAWFSLTISVIAHESWHIFQFTTKQSEIDQVCFLGYRKELIEKNGIERDFHSVGWVWVKNPGVMITEWDAWFIGSGIAIVSMLGLFEILFQRPVCFGTKEFSLNTNICKGCGSYNGCRREFNRNHRIKRF